MGRLRDYLAGVRRTISGLSLATRVTLLRAAGDPQHIDDLCHGQGCRWHVSRERWQWWS